MSVAIVKRTTFRFVPEVYEEDFRRLVLKLYESYTIRGRWYMGEEIPSGLDIIASELDMAGSETSELFLFVLDCIKWEQHECDPDHYPDPFLSQYDSQQIQSCMEVLVNFWGDEYQPLFLIDLEEMLNALQYSARDTLTGRVQNMAVVGVW